MFGGGREEGVAVSQDRSVSLRAAPRNPWPAETMGRSMAVKCVWVTSRVQRQVSISGENLGVRAKHKHCTEITWYAAFPVPLPTSLKCTGPRVGAHACNPALGGTSWKPGEMAQSVNRVPHKLEDLR